MNNKHLSKAKKFYNNIIIKLMYGDIEKAIQARLNFMVVMAMLAYTDFIGNLINGDLGFLSEKERDSYYKYKTKRKKLSREQVFQSALKYFGNSNDYLQFKLCFRDHEEPLSIYKAFRCGMIHEYYTKAATLIHNNPSVDHYIPSDKGISWHKDNKIGYVLRFHTNAYYRDFKKGVDRIFKKEIYRDKNLLSLIIESFERVERNFNNVFIDRINFRKKQK